MNPSPAAILHKLLVDINLVSNPADNVNWPAFVGTMPDGEEVPNNVVSIYDTEGGTNGRILSSGETIDIPGVQIMVRSETYPAGWDMIDKLMTALDAVTWRVVVIGTDSFIVTSIRRTSRFALGAEEKQKRRELFTLNALMKIRKGN